MSHGRACAGPCSREVGKHLGEVAVSYGEGDTDPRNYRVSFDKVASRLGSTTPAPRPPKSPLLLPMLKIRLPACCQTPPWSTWPPTRRKGKAAGQTAISDGAPGEIRTRAPASGGRIQGLMAVDGN